MRFEFELTVATGHDSESDNQTMVQLMAYGIY